MIIHIKELKQGRTALSFQIPAPSFEGYLQEVDELYGSTGTPCEVELTVDRFVDNLFLQGTVSGPRAFNCARCLVELRREWELDFHYTMFPQDSLEVERLSEQEEVELSEDDLDVSFYTGEEINLEELVRELILLELEGSPSCGKRKCPNLANVDVLVIEEDAASRIDPRWEKLIELKKNLADSNGDS